MRYTFLAFLVLAGACVGDDSTQQDSGVDATGSDVKSDAPQADAGPPRCNPTASFGTPEEVTELNGPTTNGGARLSKDELTVYWHRADVSDAFIPPTTIWVAKRPTNKDVFGSLAPVVGLAKPADAGDLYPTLLPDMSLVFHSNRSNNQRDLWLSQLANGTYNAPTQLQPFASQTVVERYPYASFDGNELYMTIQTPADGAVPVERIHRALEVSPGTYGNLTLVDLAAGSSDIDYAPVISSDHKTLYFGSSRQSASSIWTATRSGATGPFNAPSPVTELNVSTDATEPTWISDDGCVIYFQSNRPLSNPVVRIFRATRGM